MDNSLGEEDYFFVKERVRIHFEAAGESG